jgi:rhodanese-related sulfurtransferase
MSGFLTREEARSLLDQGGVVVDVRSVEEFNLGHAPDSIHLPVHLVAHLASERLPMDRPLLVCCASGARSHMAVQQLQRLGFNAHNLGPWVRHPDLP